MRGRLAEVLGIEPARVRVISPFLGGGFGSKGPVWSHVVFAAMAARQLGRPLRFAVTRPQMFGPVRWRSPTRQTRMLGASSDGVIRTSTRSPSRGSARSGAVAAIANAVHHATGRRIRDLPITLDKLL